MEKVFLAKIAAAEKEAAVKEKSLAEKLAGTRGYIDRATKRKEEAMQTLQAAQMRVDEITADLCQHQEHLVSLEREALATAQTEDQSMDGDIPP